MEIKSLHKINKQESNHFVWKKWQVLITNNDTVTYNGKTIKQKYQMHSINYWRMNNSNSNSNFNSNSKNILI